MAELILMCGIPGSGKSTYAKSFFNKNKDIYISRDQIRFSMIGEEEDYFSRENDVFKTFVNEINIALTKATRYVIADATHLNYSSRMKVLSRIKDRNTIVNCIVMEVDPLIAIERNKNRSGRSCVPEKAIMNMYNSFIPPEKGEPINSVLYINENNNIIKRKRLGGKL